MISESWIHVLIGLAFVGLVAIGAWFRWSYLARPPLALYEEIAQPLRRLQLAAATPLTDPADNGGAIPAPPRDWREAIVGRSVRLTYRIERDEQGYSHVVAANAGTWRSSQDEALRCLIVVADLLANQHRDAGLPLPAAKSRFGLDSTLPSSMRPFVAFHLAPLHHLQLMETGFDAEAASRSASNRSSS